MHHPKMINLSELPWTPWSSGPRTAVEIQDPARKLGSVHSGLRSRPVQTRRSTP